MTKQDTSILKGIAILFMVWLHCFNERIGHVFDYVDVIVEGETVRKLRPEPAFTQAIRPKS